MTDSIFRQGGPHRIKRIGPDQYSLSFSLPTDSEGRTARACPDRNCSPGYFKVKPGTGITEGQAFAYCPYCRYQAEPNQFATKEQIRYARDLAMREARPGIDRMLRNALGLGPSGKRTLGGGLVSLELSHRPSPYQPVRKPVESEVRRDVVCPHCTLDQTVFGLATWCADCGADIFLTHVEAELSVTRLMVSDIERRRKAFGSRVAAKDLENCLEDVVSIFEAAVKILVRRALLDRGHNPDQIEGELNKVGNSFQNIDRTRAHLSRRFDWTLVPAPLWDRLAAAFQMRHPITHNLGVVDRRYLQKVQRAEREGRELQITTAEITDLLSDVAEALRLIASELIEVSPQIGALSHRG